MRAKTLVFLMVAGALAPGAASRAETPADETIWVRALPVVGSVAGKTEVEALVLSPEVIKVAFYVDDEPMGDRNRPPFRAHVRFADPPSEQTLRVVALGERGRELGRHEVTVNRHDPPFGVRIVRLDADPEPGFAEVEVAVTVPRGAALEQVEILVAETSVAVSETATSDTAPFTARVPLTAGNGTVVRAEATLVDGRRIDDAAVVGGALTEEVAVNLVELQALVTSRNGRPLSGLVKDDFEIRQDKTVQTIDRFYRADDVALSIALLVDSSGSMAPIWDRTVEASWRFLDSVLLTRDRALLVEFDDAIRLAHGLTGEPQAIVEALGAIVPEGGTALYDSMLFSLLQLVEVPGRRALVVISDGVDFGSRSQPERVVEVARRLGVPIYIVSLPSGGGGRNAALSRGGVQAAAPVGADLRLLAEPTGGRVFRVPSSQGLTRALAQIGEELRNQYVLSYYAESLPRGPKSIDVRIPGQKGIKVRSVFAHDGDS